MSALRRITAVLAGLAVGFLLMEAVLRAAGWAPMQRHAMASFHDRHPTLGWVGAAGYEARFRSPEFDVVIGSDDEGFRVPGHGVRLDPEAPLVFVDAPRFPGGFRIAGRYEQDGRWRVRAVVDGQAIEVEGEDVETVADALVAAALEVLQGS